MTEQEIKAAYYAELDEMEQYYKTDSGSYSWNNVTISVQSSNLTVLGSIYAANGTEVCGPNTVWVPYTMLSSSTLKLGWNNLTQSGFCLILGNATSLNANATFSNFEYLKFSSGWRFDISSMLYQGRPATSVDLQVDTVDQIWPTNLSGVTPTGNSITDTQWLIDHWYYLAMGIGLIVFIGGIVMRSGMILGIGILIALVGVGAYYVTAGRVRWDPLIDPSGDRPADLLGPKPQVIR